MYVSRRVIFNAHRKLGDSEYYITAGGASAQHDLDWITTVVQNEGFDCTIMDRTQEFGVLSLQVRAEGPYKT